MQTKIQITFVWYIKVQTRRPQEMDTASDRVPECQVFISFGSFIW